MHVWDLSKPTAKPTIKQSPLYLNSSRYVLLSHSAAMVTGGETSATSCVKVGLRNGEIVELPELLRKHEWHGIARLGRAVYISGGCFMPSTAKYAEKYEDGRWVEIADMTVPRYNHTLCAYLKRIYAFGGSNSVYLDSIEYYDGMIWTLAPMKLPTARNYSSVLPVKTGLLLVAGFSPSNQKKLVHIWEEGNKRWRELGPISTTYSLSNALALRKGVVYMYSWSPSQDTFSLISHIE